jgi:hypothetical protein
VSTDPYYRLRKAVPHVVSLSVLRRKGKRIKQRESDNTTDLCDRMGWVGGVTGRQEQKGPCSSKGEGEA